MKSSIAGRIEKIEKAIAPAQRQHVIWDNGTPGAFAQEKAALIASGRVKEGDRFIRIGWVQTRLLKQ
jgi:hypothetical protein